MTDGFTFSPIYKTARYEQPALYYRINYLNNLELLTPSINKNPTTHFLLHEHILYSMCIDLCSGRKKYQC